MNELIREVWIKAAREDSDPDNWDTQEQFIERFAQLIVRECIEAARTVGGSAGVEVETIIRNHFGVEE